jgi:AcrR family transcriptional regulator
MIMMNNEADVDAVGTRERAVRHADGLLVAGGYAAMSLEAVAHAVGIRKASLYHHFPRGKDQLFVAVVERRTAPDGAAVSGATAELPDTFARLRAIARHFNEVAQTRPYHALNDMAAHLPEQHRDFVHRLIDERVMAPVRAVIVEGVRSKELRRCDPDLAARAFVMLMASLGKIDKDDPRRASLPEFIVTLFADGLRASSGDDRSANGRRAAPRERGPSGRASPRGANPGRRRPG